MSLRGARQGDVAISLTERRRLLRFARNDIEGQTSSPRDCSHSIEGVLKSNIIGISRSPLYGSLEMTIEKLYLDPILKKKPPHSAGAFRDQLKELMRSLRLRPGVPWDLVQQ